MKKEIIWLLLIVSCLVISGCGGEKPNAKVDDEVVNKVTTFNLDDKSTDEFKFTETTIRVELENLSVFKVKVNNISNVPKKISFVDVTFKDKDDKVIIVLSGYVDKTIEVNDSVVVNCTTDVNLNKVKSVEYLIKE